VRGKGGRREHEKKLLKANQGRLGRRKKPDSISEGRRLLGGPALDGSLNKILKIKSGRGSKTRQPDRKYSEGHVRKKGRDEGPCFKPEGTAPTAEPFAIRKLSKE